MAEDLLLLDNDEIAGVFDLGACMSALEKAYRAAADGRAVERARSQTRVPLDEPGVTYCFKSMEGALVGDGYMTLRLTSDAVFEGKVDGRARRDKLARGPGGTYCGLIMLFSTRDVVPLAMLHDGLIQLARVACTSALSVRLLAREDASDLALLGAGEQAWWHLKAAAAVRALRRVRIYSPTVERRESLAARAREELGIAAEAAASAQDAVSGADIVIAATNASEPVLDGRWLAPGAHVVSIVSGDKGSTRRELDDETLRRAALVVAHSKAGAIEHRNGDLAGPVEAGILSWEKIIDLPDLVAGNSPRRKDRNDITVFKNNGGTGLQFAAVGPVVYERALAAGIGRKLPVGWFMESMKS
ncbi:MAG: ornithine cyclodeaminase family protein [Burkholderiales bacterium]|nr:ornithine cyclodeaminase family protein [Burkholderiales bacterium]